VRGLLIRWAIVALGLWVASRLVPGIHIDDTATLILAAAVLGIVNAVVRPIVVLLTLPLTVLTLGLFLWLVNAAMFGLAARLVTGFHVAGVVPALLGSLLVSITGWIASWYVGPRGQVEVLVVQEHR
jgi:putative membrane protein